MWLVPHVPDIIHTSAVYACAVGNRLGQSLGTIAFTHFTHPKETATKVQHLNLNWCLVSHHAHRPAITHRAYFVYCFHTPVVRIPVRVSLLWRGSSCWRRGPLRQTHISI